MFGASADVGMFGGSKKSHPIVAVADNNPSTKAMYTPNVAVTAPVQVTVPSSRYTDVAYNGAGLYVAVNKVSNDTATSPDGQNWTIHSGALTGAFGGVNVGCAAMIFGNGKFVAYNNGINKSAYSTDGINWTLQALPSGVSLSGRTSCYGNGGFFACAQGSTSAGFATNPTTTWTSVTMPAALNWNAVAYLPGVGFCAVNQTTGTTSTSTTGSSGWTNHASALPWGAGAICTDGKQFIASQFGGGAVATSPDGITWTTHGTPFGGGLNAGCLLYDGKYVVGVINSGSGNSAYSGDGINWTTFTATADGYQGACSGYLQNGTF